MKIGSWVVVWKFEIVSTSVTSWVLLVNSGQAVKRLMNVSKIMNEQSHGIWFGFWFVVFHGLHHLNINEVILIAWSFCEPVNKSSYGRSNIFLIRLEIRVLVDCATLIKVWSISKVPNALPAASFHLDVVSKAWTLSEWVVFFFHGNNWIYVSEDLKDVGGLFQSCRSFSIKDVICNSCN